MDQDVPDKADKFWHDIEERYEQGRHDLERPLLSPGEMFFKPEEILKRVKQFAQIHISNMERAEKSDSANYATMIHSVK